MSETMIWLLWDVQWESLVTRIHLIITAKDDCCSHWWKELQPTHSSNWSQCCLREMLRKALASVPVSNMKFASVLVLLFFCSTFKKSHGKSKPKPGCEYPPSQWCRSLEIAIECGVSLEYRYQVQITALGHNASC